MAAQILGIIDVYWQGQHLDVKPGGSLTLGGVVSQPIVYGRSVGRGEHMMASEVSVEVMIKAGMRVGDVIKKNTEGELQVKCDTGQTFAWSDGFVKDAITISSGDNSSAKVMFSAGEPMEV